MDSLQNFPTPVGMPSAQKKMVMVRFTDYNFASHLLGYPCLFVQCLSKYTDKKDFALGFAPQIRIVMLLFFFLFCQPCQKYVSVSIAWEICLGNFYFFFLFVLGKITAEMETILKNSALTRCRPKLLTRPRCLGFIKLLTPVAVLLLKTHAVSLMRTNLYFKKRF